MASETREPCTVSPGPGAAVGGRQHEDAARHQGVPAGQRPRHVRRHHVRRDLDPAPARTCAASPPTETRRDASRSCRPRCSDAPRSAARTTRASCARTRWGLPDRSRCVTSSVSKAKLNSGSLRHARLGVELTAVEVADARHARVIHLQHRLRRARPHDRENLQRRGLVGRRHLERLRDTGRR